jgi:type IV pilus assembly protein PilY1
MNKTYKRRDVMVTTFSGVSLRPFFNMKIILFLCILAVPFLFPLQSSGVDDMNEFCAVPPFIASGGVPPNVLLALDNSGSMYDLNYVDAGHPLREAQFCYDQTFDNTKPYVGYFHNNVCSVTTSTACLIDADCPGGETCEEALYQFFGECSGGGGKCTNDSECNPDGGSYCQEFNIIDTGFPALADCEYARPNIFCVSFDTSGGDKVLDLFVASGKFMNWLTASKFDVQKKILTGGKFNTDSTELTSETRGCVGRRFIKEPNTADFIEYNENDPLGNPNTSAGVTFAVSGPRHSVNSAAPSPGGRTIIEFFEGDFGQELCQAAVDAFEEGHDPSSIRRAVEACLSFVPAGGVCRIATDGMGNPLPCSDNRGCKDVSGDSKDRCLDAAGETAETKRKVVFQQSIQACWQYLRWLKGEGGNDIGNDEANTVINQCNEVYPAGTCSDGVTSCNNDSDCTDPDTCNYGPDGIFPGNPALLCSRAYGGYCYDGADPWPGDAWVGREYADEIECIRVKHREFCGDIDIPPVIDPTDDASDTSLYANLPAILGDIGIESQLGEPFARLNVDVLTGAEPTGLLQKFSRTIRFGAMSFNNQGSPTECPVDDSVACPSFCSNNTDFTCISHADCPGYDPFDASTWYCTPVAALPDVTNSDGGQVIHYIGGFGKCSVNTGTACDEDTDCPDFLTGETCNMVGDHTMGTCKLDPALSCDRDIECNTVADDECVTTLINRIDGIKAETWTPFSEALYNAIGYFARLTPHTLPPSFGTSRGQSSASPVEINADDFDDDKNPSQYECQTNNVLIITDGLPTTDLHPDVTALAISYPDPDDNEQDVVAGACPKFSGSRNLDDLAWLGQNRDITDFTQANTPAFGSAYKSIFTHVVFNGTETEDPGECNPKTLLEETALKGGGEYVEAHTPQDLEKGLLKILSQLSGEAASGTAASVLASGADKGANILQAIFYPRRNFFESLNETWERSWTGTFQNLWYYIDPFIGTTSIREDTPSKPDDPTTQDSILNIDDDFIVSFYFDAGSLKTRVKLYDDDGDSDFSDLVLEDDREFENINPLWEAGRLLWQRDILSAPPAGNPRTIKTSTDGYNFSDFSIANSGTLSPYLQAGSVEEAEAIIRYTHGEDGHCEDPPHQPCSTSADCTDPDKEDCLIGTFPGEFRSRTAPIDLNNDGDVDDAGESPKVWKLADIINATPGIMTWVPLNDYDRLYLDETYEEFVTSHEYSNRGLVFTGANSGILHAFKLGLLEVDWVGRDTQLVHARLRNPSTGNLCDSADTEPCGEEVWAYAPRNVLPYLKYKMDPGYCHIYTVDGSPLIFDASIRKHTDCTTADPADCPRQTTIDKTDADGDGFINDVDFDKTSWRTILIGSMNYGGACRASDDPACTDCVKAPGVDLDDSKAVDTDAEKQLGMSSYFAIDITDPDPANWDLLWEFASEDLGFSTTGPSVVRISTKDIDGNSEEDTNGHWFVLLTTGPTGPISEQQFMGRSDKDLKVFVLDLKDGSIETVIDTFGGTAIQNAFGGSIIDATIDPDFNYEDDGFYIPYTTKNAAQAPPNNLTSGGIVRVLTDENPDPTTWKASRLIQDIGTVNAGTSRIQNLVSKKLWVFFGEGRYFFKKGITLDDPVNQRTLVGLKDPCFSKGGTPAAGLSKYDFNCSDSVDFSDLLDVTLDPAAAEDNEGWFISLDAQDITTFLDAERVITDPVESTAGSGSVFFTSFKPSANICTFGGVSHIWALQHNTGGAIAGLKGKALVQVSTGSIEEIDLSDAFTEQDDPNEPGYNPDSKGGRRSGPMTGKPPEGPGLVLLTEPPPYSNIIHIQER